jgi:hypothetical protein
MNQNIILIKLMDKEYNTIISLVGGPLCGNSLTAKDGRIPSSVPMFYEGKFYNYELIIEQDEFWTNIHYKYTNEVLEVNNTLENK